MIKKLPFAILIFFLASLVTRGQETAMDFNQPDCAGTEHHLFSELDAGKVVILEFVMLNCAPCITATKAIEKIRSTYEAEYPGRVALYSMGFLNLYNCNQMSAWMNNNNFTHSVFTGGEQQVAYYGGMGMPTIIILGSADHKVYFKSSGYTPSLDGQIRTAIDSALTYSALGIGENINRTDFIAYPTISSNDFTFKVNLSGKSVISIFSITGHEVISMPINDRGSYTLNAINLPSGLYVARLKTPEGYSQGIKLIKQ